MAIPGQFSTATGTIFGAVDGLNKSFAVPVFNPPAKMVFVNGVLSTPGLDYSVSGFTLTFVTPPLNGYAVSEQAYNSSLSTSVLPLNIPTEFSSYAGTITGALNGMNNIFTLATTGLVTDLLYFWKGGLLTQGVDYTWACTQATSAGGWQTVVTMIAGNIPQPGDILLAQAFSS